MRSEMLVRKRFAAGCIAATALILACSSGPAWALQPKQGSVLSEKEFFLPELYISSSHEPIAAVVTRLPNSQAWQDYLAGFQAAGLSVPEVYIDPRSGVATNLVDAVPLIPGSGFGNQVTLDELGARIGRAIDGVDAAVVADAVRQHVIAQSELLGVRRDQLGAVRAVQVSPTLWQARIPQTYQGVPVRHGHLVATINRGNLVLMGTESWGEVRKLDVVPTFTSDDAMAAGFAYAGGASTADILVRHPALEIVPVAPQRFQDGEAFAGPVGRGYGHRLVWTYAFQRPPELEVWEVMFDAHSSEVIAFQDLNQYADEQIKGGVYPITSTEICPTPGTCGEMQSGWPMPFADTGLAAPDNFTNSGGVFNHTGGTATTTLSGRFVDIVDNCGGISESGSGTIDLGGVNGDHDCTTPPGASAGNTPASRTAFYELNKQIEQGKSWLPGNTWLQSQLTSNVNINNTCNAFWSITFQTVNFYRSGGGCRNTGELAGVFDHEWAHGLDDNDAGGALSNSSEAYADIAGIYRLQDSCVGHGFFESIDDGCGMTSDGTGFNSNEAQVGAPHCDTDCSGVRDADWARHNPPGPDTALGFVCNQCNTSSGPCGRQVHCAAAPSRQAAWDFVTRDLPAMGYDSQTSFLIGNKVFYQGSGNIGTWHACTCGSSSSGCGSTNAYMQWLAADDDNGNLNDGTPHMTALFDAFDRHGIACATPTPQVGGCAAGPSGAATLTASPGNSQISLDWSAVAGASNYWVLRTEGHAGCDFGKAIVATVGGTSYTDTEVANGRDYHYNVVAVGTSDACFGGVSNCETVQPVGAPDFSVSCTPASHTVQQGANAVSTCTVSSSFGYTGTVGLSCAGQPAGVGCAFSPASVVVPVDGSANSTLTMSVALGQATGTFDFDIEGSDGTATRTSVMTLNVIPEGSNGPQVAVYNPTYQAPACMIPGSECDSTTLVDSRDSLSPAEPNQPNTINNSCADGTAGSYHNDESNDRIVVRTLDGADFSEGATVEIDATVYAWSTGSSDTVDFFYAADASSPSWTLIGSQVTPTGGLQTISAQYTLPAGAVQAVRVQFRYQSTNAPCSTGSYNDRDDLVFAVNPTAQCTVNADCSDGLFCNGEEVCNAGTCEAGTPPACDDGEFCNGAETCNETTDSCEAGTPPACDDGTFCNGTETCNETTDSCEAGTPPACDDGTFCNGTETCNETTDTCDPGTPPSCDDGVACTDDSCNTGTDSCDNVPNNANCDNGQFCDGAETCDAVNDCQAGSDPCPGQICDEVADVCVSCATNADCSNGVFCDGAETCNAGVCQPGTPPTCDDGVSCTVDSCNETTDSCDTVPNDGLCDNGLFCDGAELCDAVLDCQAGTEPCGVDETCDESQDICVGICLEKKASCTDDSECCSGKCRGKAGSKSCK